MADSKLTSLTAITSATTDDLMYLVDNPGGTPTSKKITFDNVQKSVDHTVIQNIGSNTHAQIDTALTRLANTSGTNTGDQDLSGYTLKTTFIDSEIVSGSGTTFTLANTPVSGSLKLYAGRNRLYPTTDYSISTATITTILSWSTGDLLADYRK